MVKQRDIFQQIAVDSSRQIAQLMEQGFSATAIAETLNLPISEVRAHIRTINEAVLEKFQHTTGAELLVQSNAFLEKVKQYAIKEMQMSAKKVQKVIRPDGTVEEVEVVDPNRPKFLMGAPRAEEMRMKQLFKAGLIPSNNPEQLFQGLADLRERSKKLNAIESSENAEDKEERSKDEILESIEQLLQHGPRL